MISEVNPLPLGAPVQGLGFPDGLVPDDGERLYSHPPKKKTKKVKFRETGGMLGIF